MPTNLTQTPQYVATISHPDPGDSASASQLKTGVSQILADRTRLSFLDIGGIKIAGLAQATVGGAGQFFGVVEGFAATTNGVIAYGGAPYTSPDGDDSTWTSRSFGGGYGGVMRDAATDGSRIVFVGSADGIQTTDDGATYTSRTPGAGAANPVYYTGVAYGGGVFVAVGFDTVANTHEIQSSADGATWTRRTSALGSAGNTTVVYHQGRFVCVAVEGSGNGAIVATSADGTTWTAATPIADGNAWPFPKIIANGTRLAVAGWGAIYYSDDIAASWTTVAIAANAGGAWVGYGGGISGSGLFVVSGSRQTTSLAEVFISDDGAEWFSCGTISAIGGQEQVSFVLGRWWHGYASGPGVVLRSIRSANI